MPRIQVAIIVGSDSDLPIISSTVKTLDNLGIKSSVNVASAHRTPQKVKQCVRSAQSNGAEVFIAAAGMAAALPGVVASETTQPVIGIPIEGKSLTGLDSLFSIVQMPPVIPVATVAIGKAGAVNAAVLAAEILSVKYRPIKAKLTAYRKKMALGIEKKDAALQKMGVEKYIESVKK